MNKITEQFVPYKQAKELKELGFDEECIGYYKDSKLSTSTNRSLESGYFDCKNSEKTILEFYQLNCFAPLWQQAFDWFREKYEYDIYVFPSVPEMMNRIDKIKKYSANVYHRNRNPRLWSEYYDTFQECQLACLDKLIELVKEKK